MRLTSSTSAKFPSGVGVQGSCGCVPGGRSPGNHAKQHQAHGRFLLRGIHTSPPKATQWSLSGAGQLFLSRHLGKRDKPIILKAGKSNLLHGDRGHSGGPRGGQGGGGQCGH